MTAPATASSRRYLTGRRSLGMGIAFLLVVVHAHVVGRPDVSGALLVLDHIFNVLLAAAVLALCTAVGLRVHRTVRLLPEELLERLSIALAVGVGCLGTVLLLLGAVGALADIWILLVFAAAAILCLREIATLPALVKDGVRQIVDWTGPAWIIPSVVVVIAMLVLAVAPPTDWDSLMYHLQIPQQFLSAGSVFVPEDNLHISFVGLVHMLYVPLLAAGAPAACAVLNVLFGCALMVLLLSSGRSFFGSTTGQLAQLVIWGSPLLLLAAVTPRVDVVLAWFLFLGHYALVRAGSTQPSGTPWVAISGIVLGLALGTKHLAVLYIAALAPLLLAVSVRDDRGSGTVHRVVTWGTCLTLAAVPWLLKNWILLGAPFYPQLADRALPPWLAAIYGSSDVPSSIPASSLHPLGDIRTPFSIIDWFVAPQRMTPEAEGTAYRANLLFLVLPLGLLMMRNRRLVAFALPPILFIAGLLLYNTSLNLRYLIPALPALTLCCTAIVGKVTDHVHRNWLVPALLIAAAAISIAPTAQVIAAQVEQRDALSHVSGQMSRSAYLRNPTNVESSGYMRIVDRVNSITKRDDTILMFFEARGLRFHAGSLQDNNLTNWPLLAPAVQPPHCLEVTPATHVFVATGVLGYYRRRGLDPATLGWDGFGAFAERCLKPVTGGPGWVLMEPIAAGS